MNSDCDCDCMVMAKVRVIECLRFDFNFEFEFDVDLTFVNCSHCTYTRHVTWSVRQCECVQQIQIHKYLRRRYCRSVSAVVAVAADEGWRLVLRRIWAMAANGNGFVINNGNLIT